MIPGVCFKIHKQIFVNGKVLVEANIAINCWIRVMDIWIFIVLVSPFLCMLGILHSRKIKVIDATEDIFVHKSLPAP